MKNESRSVASLPTRIYRFYRDGFMNMTIGKSLWVIILIKLAVIFLVLKLFFFPDFLSSKSSDEGTSKAETVLNEMASRTTGE